jgi:hypothetical protein
MGKFVQDEPIFVMPQAGGSGVISGAPVDSKADGKTDSKPASIPVVDDPFASEGMNLTAQINEAVGVESSLPVEPAAPDPLPATSPSFPEASKLEVANQIASSQTKMSEAEAARAELRSAYAGLGGDKVTQEQEDRFRKADEAAQKFFPDYRKAVENTETIHSQSTPAGAHNADSAVSADGSKVLRSSDLDAAVAAENSAFNAVLDGTALSTEVLGSASLPPPGRMTSRFQDETKAQVDKLVDEHLKQDEPVPSVAAPVAEPPMPPMPDETTSPPAAKPAKPTPPAERTIAQKFSDGTVSFGTENSSKGDAELEKRFFSENKDIDTFENGFAKNYSFKDINEDGTEELVANSSGMAVSESTTKQFIEARDRADEAHAVVMDEAVRDDIRQGKVGSADSTSFPALAEARDLRDQATSNPDSFTQEQRDAISLRYEEELAAVTSGERKSNAQVHRNEQKQARLRAKQDEDFATEPRHSNNAKEKIESRKAALNTLEDAKNAKLQQAAQARMQSSGGAFGDDEEDISGSLDTDAGSPLRMLAGRRVSRPQPSSMPNNADNIDPTSNQGAVESAIDSAIEGSDKFNSSIVRLLQAISDSTVSNASKIDQLEQMIRRAT